MPPMHVLIIDDEPAAREVLADVVRRAGYSVDVAATAAEATTKLSSGEADVALCDIQLPDGHGIDILKKSRSSRLDTQFVMMTGFASVETAVEALRGGAFDYIIKPVRHAEVLHRLSQIDAMAGLRAENSALRVASHPAPTTDLPGMLPVERLVAKVAPTTSSVLITGESGSGKGVVARMIHDRSTRRDGPFLQINCAAIPDQLLESEFFGHTKGAFTGADRARKGLLLEADHGTLFLDEISELPLHMQSKLLLVIEEKEVRQLGSSQTRRVGTRIVAATNRNLPELVKSGRFREDLYFRLCTFQIEVPPLRARPDDIRPVIDHFLRASQHAWPAAARAKVEPEAMQAMLAYAWPGNVRELQNAIARACILAEGQRICLEDLPAEVQAAYAPAAPAPSPADKESLLDLRRNFELEVIRRTIEQHGGDRRLAAQRLGISVSSLYRKLENPGRHCK